MRSWIKQAVATGVSAALILSTPGLPAYRVFAAEIVAPKAVQPVTPVGGLGASGVSAIGSVQSPLGGGLQTGAGLGSVLPNIGSVQVNAAPNLNISKPLSVAANIPVVGRGIQGPVGRVGQALIQRSEANGAAPKGMMEVLVQGLKGPQGAKSSGVAKWLKPAEGTLNSGASSKDWGAKSFAALRGQNVSAPVSGAVDASNLQPGAVKPGGLFGLKRAPSGRSQAAPSEPAAPGEAKKAKPQLNPKVQLGISIVAAVGFGVASYFGWGPFGAAINVFGMFTLTWPMMLGVQVAMIGFKSFKLWKTGKKEAAEKAAKKADDAARYEPEILESEKAAQVLEGMLAGGKQAEVSIYEDVTGRFHPAPVSQELIAKVRAGEFQAATDNTGAISLARIEKIDDEGAGQPEKTEVKKDSAETPAAEQKNAEQAKERNAADDAVAEEQAVQEPAAEKAVQAAPAEPVAAQPRSRRGLYGAAIGSVLGMAVSLFFPVESIVVPFIAYAVAEALPGRQGVVRAKRSVGSFAGIAVGTLAMAYLSTFGIPHLMLVALPALGAALGFGLERLWDQRQAAKASSKSVQPAEQAVPDEIPAEPVEDDGVVSAAKAKGEVVQAPRLEPVKDEAVSKKEEPVVEQTEAPAAEKAASTSPNPSGLAGDAPRSFLKFNAEARGIDAQSLRAGKAAAQKRARKIAGDARLVRVAHNLSDPKGKPIYYFHSRKAGQIITVYKTRVDVKSDVRPGKPGEGRWVLLGTQGSPNPLRTADGMWNTRLAGVRSLESAFTALKKEAHWMSPVRVELISKWKSDPVYAFIDAAGNVRTVPAVIREEKQPENAPKEKPEAKKSAKEGVRKEKRAEQPPVASSEEVVKEQPSTETVEGAPKEKAPVDEALGPPEARAPPVNEGAQAPPGDSGK